MPGDHQPFAFSIVEWLALRIEGSQGRALTLAEAEKLCEHTGLRVERSHAFPVDAICAWVGRCRIEG